MSPEQYFHPLSAAVEGWRRRHVAGEGLFWDEDRGLTRLAGQEAQVFERAPSLEAILAAASSSVKAGRRAPLENIRIDLPVLGFSLLLALGTNLLFGFTPALHASRSASGRGLAETNSSQAVATLGRLPLQRILIVFELALSIILLSSVGLMLRSLWSLQRADLGVDPKDVLTVILDLPDEKYSEPMRRTQAVEAMTDQLRAQPEIAEAGAVSALPFSALMDGIRFLIEEESTGTEQHLQIATLQVITPGYLEAMGLHLVQGRGFTSGDRRENPPVALISETLARSHWANRNPVGQRIALGKTNIDARRWSTVVGVVQDLRLQGRTTAARPVIYQPAAQVFSSTMTLVGRVKKGATTGPAALRQSIWAVDLGLPIELRTMRERLDEAALQPRVGAWILGLFASVALALGALGIYGIVSYSVAARRREIAIRMALGAQRREITALFLRSALTMVLVDLLLGLGGRPGPSEHAVRPELDPTCDASLDCGVPLHDRSGVHVSAGEGRPAQRRYRRGAARVLMREPGAHAPGCTLPPLRGWRCVVAPQRPAIRTDRAPKGRSRPRAPQQPMRPAPRGSSSL